ncbi:MAG: hypothetical protein K2P14_03610 [Anaeroplasmataceae bacterium]|nr:hypothetical protein [Anaeroplasmataceae bacterium]
MAMFPIFMIGLVVGGIVGYTYSIYKKETPSETRLKLLEAEIITLKSDKEMLEKCIQKKDKNIEQLKQDIEVFEKRK